MNILEIIDKKKKNIELTKDEIEFAVNNYVNGNIADYQMSALLMAIVINGMTNDEIYNLTDVFIKSGDTINLDNINGTVVDKHSTGGVGDKTSLVVLPIVSSLGIKVAKMSGRGLGHTGGTIDKLESISGYRVELNKDDFLKQVNDIGIVLTSQSGNLVPADKKIYALRDVTSTTDSIPLIASSIMSKKIASGAKYIVIDVKVGDGALMKNINDAKKLAHTMIDIGKKYNRVVTCILTNMSEPLGYAIGNGLEVKEAIDCLNNNGPSDLKEVVITLASEMVKLGKDIEISEAKKLVIDALESGKAYNKFKEFIEYQGGNVDRICISENVISIKSKETGFIEDINTELLGKLAKDIGAGRNKKDDIIDYGVGFVLSKKIGDYVIENEELLKIYINSKDVKIDDIVNCFKIGNTSKEVKLILDIIR